MGAGDAFDMLLERLPATAAARETAGLSACLGRYLARVVVSPEEVPAFPRSTMDGFAVRAADTFGASEASPSYLNVTGRVLMGQAAEIALEAGQAAHIPTGGMMPAGADAVVMVEYTSMLDESTLEVTRAAGPGENVVAAGEDIRGGEVLLAAGHRLGPYDLGALAAIGVTEVEVWKRLRVGILSTGDELVAAGQKPEPGQVRDINYHALAALVARSGGEPVRLGICPDNMEILERTLREALSHCRIILISGGSSVGAADLTPAAINRLGPPGVLVHGLSIKPGKPTIIGLSGEVPIFGLPGHPVGALDVYGLLVDPLIRFLLSGARERGPCFRLKAKLGRSISSVSGREDRVRVSLEWRDGETWAQPLLGKSGLISLMTRADAVAVIPLDAEGAAQGDEVEVEPLFRL
ncbi:MAG: molybdopterin molybdotransferase MoeA [Thermoleophilia bacterium]|nr:molybdopterin molybdotransferase MoeA [Thermoleophilia bacterium]